MYRKSGSFSNWITFYLSNSGYFCLQAALQPRACIVQFPNLFIFVDSLAFFFVFFKPKLDFFSQKANTYTDTHIHTRTVRRALNFCFYMLVWFCLRMCMCACVCAVNMVRYYCTFCANVMCWSINVWMCTCVRNSVTYLCWTAPRKM